MNTHTHTQSFHIHALFTHTHVHAYLFHTHTIYMHCDAHTRTTFSNAHVHTHKDVMMCSVCLKLTWQITGKITKLIFILDLRTQCHQKKCWISQNLWVVSIKIVPHRASSPVLELPWLHMLGWLGLLCRRWFLWRGT